MLDIRLFDYFQDDSDDINQKKIIIHNMFVTRKEFKDSVVLTSKASL
jgi:hypothetical protein